MRAEFLTSYGIYEIFDQKLKSYKKEFYPSIKTNRVETFSKTKPAKDINIFGKLSPKL